MSFVLIILTFLFITAVALVKIENKGTVAAIGVIASALLSSWVAIGVLKGGSYAEVLYGGTVFGNITVKADGLSAWFVLITNFTAITGILYGRQYLKAYPVKSADLSFHYISYLLNQLALTGIYFIQNALAFLCFWEIMALSAFLLVIFEHGRMDTLKAGINYLIQSHICVIMLTLGFIWVYSSTGSFDFTAITSYCMSAGKGASFLLFLVFFIGFAIKAGFVPFHTWLPHAHPAAPSHVSGLMSGVIIKSGIYGILRILLLMPVHHLEIGYFILVISVITGVYGVLLATVQHNIKRLLAYHSIENIGIIGIGIGLGAIGMGLQNPLLAFAGYAGALLHVLNHSLFKSLLFFSAGNIYHATHTLNIDRMGGLIRKMPYTAFFFLLAALAICGLPPFNGFISEFLIYTGLFSAISAGNQAAIVVLAMIGLALIGGLALLCFTKAFGIIFLGTNRSNNTTAREANSSALFPKYLIAVFIVIIGILPQLFIVALQSPVSLFTGDFAISETTTGLILVMQKISLSVWLLIIVVAVLFFIRKLIARQAVLTKYPTWGCGYQTDSPRIQYTASSYVRSYAKLIKPLLSMKKTKDEINDIIPGPIHAETQFHDKIERGLVDWPVRNLKSFLGIFKFLQNGSVQFYVLYGVVFIAISITIPMIINVLQYIAQLLKQL